MAFDVAVVGGGPAGTATALALRAHAPRLTVAIYESSRYDEPRIGETLPPPARRLLEQHGVWAAFAAQRHKVVHGTASAWGEATARDQHFLFAAAGTGWHLDRAAFDAMLAYEAERRGATLFLGTRVQSAEDIPARFVVDATGTAAIARSRGARVVAADRLVSFARTFDDAGGDPRTFVESFADGWWYTAALPGGKRIAACMTDHDIGRHLGLHDDAGWEQAFASMPLTSSLAPRIEKAGPVVVRACDSRRLDSPCADDWLAVGDAASRFDPLSSQGIMKALRGGAFAAYAVGDFLTRGDDSGLRRYRSFIAAEFEGYLATRAEYYAEEGRWAEREFWRRRGPYESNATPPMGRP